MKYDFKAVEAKWQKVWQDEHTFHAEIDHSKPKFYALVEFPYPSAAGLHVGHPRSYTALDIVARKKRQCGYNVLYPMGWDAFGLPTENYALKNHINPEIVTAKNVARFKSQLQALGLSFDWDREINTTDPEYYKWTQWIFLQLYKHGLAYKKATTVNYCTGCKVVLANEEVVNGVCERCGSPVVQRVKSQWMLKITAYADRLIDDLDQVDYIDRVKTQQRNWIGRSHGAEVNFETSAGDTLTVYTTRADTLFGVTYMVISPEHAYIKKWIDAGLIKNVDAVKAYQDEAARKSDFERTELNKEKTGVKIEGVTAIDPVNGAEVPIFISDYVLATYGTGAIMAVPAHDSRDYAFAKKFGLPIIPLIEGCDVSDESFDAKEGKMINSGFLNGLDVKEAIPAAIDYVEKHGIGHRKVNYRLRDAIFSRQRYWGEPFPIYYKDGIPTPVPFEKLPLQLPEITEFKPTENGEPPLARAKDWTYEGYPLETSTMPGFAGSSAYYLRYMDPHNNEALVDRKVDEYWRDVDLYIGGTEHATGHLIYSRFWDKFLFDLGYVCEDEPFRKLVNQGMIQGRSNFVYRIVGTNTFVSLGLKDQYETTEIHVDINIVRNDKLDLEAFKKWRPEFADAEFILENGEYVCGWAVEKMSKSMYNVVNPDRICDDYGADTLRLYEMFLGPLEQSKPWDTKGIDGVNRFLRKFWRLFYDGDNFIVTDEKATPAELKVLHKLITKEQDDIEHFSYNTTVSAFMIALNELSGLKCHKREILEPLTVMLSPFTPHIAEELWEALGHNESITFAHFPEFNAALAAEDNVTYPVSFNGKMRFTVDLPKSLSPKEVEARIREMEQTSKYVGGQNVVKVIVVPGKIVNFVLK